MRTIRTVMATTHVDRHNDRFALEGLESLATQVNSTYLPFIFNHDPRCAPMGRVIKADLIALADGEHAIEAEVEIFEPGPLPPLDLSRASPFRDLPADTLLLTIDRTFSLPEFENAVSGIATLFGHQPRYEVKKALDPIAVLGIGLGSVAVGKFAGSFFSRLGSNSADTFSMYLKKIFARKEDDQVRLLKFEFEFEHVGRHCRADIILSGPSETEIDQFLSDGLARIDRLLPDYLAPPQSGLVRYVFEYSDGRASLKFAVRSDAVPVFPKSNEDSSLELERGTSE